MANEQYISGPTRGLPGRKMKPEYDARCDDHEDRLAVIKIQGETDSFGAEYFYMCQECLTEHEAQSDEDESTCDWCKKMAMLKPIRDLTEGSCGPVYYVCPSCAGKNLKHALEE